MRRRLLAWSVAAVAAATVASACGTPAVAPPAGDGPQIVVTTTILGAVVADLVDGDGAVEVLMQPGQDPHELVLSARQVQLLREADLVVANGLGLETSLTDALAAAEEAGVPVLRVGEALNPITLGDGVDPHVWLDPERMASAVRLIGQQLAAVDPDETSAWPQRAADLADTLAAADAELAATLATIPEGCRTLVTNHEALGYLAARYDLTIVGTVIPGTSTQAAPSPQDLAELVAAVEANGVRAIFTDTSASTRLAEAVAAEVGRPIEIVALYTESLGKPGSGADTYLGLLATDARRIADALADCERAR